MGSISDVNITKEVITNLEPAPRPKTGTLLQVRHGKVQTLVDEPSAIFKEEHDEPVFVGNTGLLGDEHVYHTHGGTERDVMQYASSHYIDWRAETSPKSDLFQYGGFGENFVATNMTEDNVCIGDLYLVGERVILQVSEPRSPCNKINKRFQWPRALKRTQRTGRVGWLYRVLQTGYVQKGDTIALIERPHPSWSLLNVKRVIQGRSVPLPLVQELAELEVATEIVRDLAHKRLETSSKLYTLVKCENITSRVKHLTFELNEEITISRARFRPHSFAKVDFGPDLSISRTYSIVSGDLNKFSLGVALDDYSQGGSAYVHKNLELGDRIQMSPGFDRKAVQDDEKFAKEGCVAKRLVIIGGIGVTAFLSIIEEWEKNGLAYEIHYAVRSPVEAAFSRNLPSNKTTIYAKSRNERLSVENIIPKPGADGTYNTKIYICGPLGLMKACRQRTQDLGYPTHMLHFESFGGVAGGPLGDPFPVEVKDLDSGRELSVTVPSDKTLLQVLRDAGFDMTFFCERGGCGSCKVTLREGSVQHRGSGLSEKEKSFAMLSCVDRGLSRIIIELD